MGNLQLSESEKDLLNVLGKYPDMPLKELVNRVEYRRANTVIKKIEKFKKQGIIYGLFHEIDYSKLPKLTPIFMTTSWCKLSYGHEFI